MRILFLTGRLPYPPNRGDRLRAYHFLRVLSQEHQVTLLSFIADERETGNIGPLRPYCDDIQLVHRGQWQSKLGAAMNFWRPLPLQSLYYRSQVMQQAVSSILARRRFDAVYVHLFRMAQYIGNRSSLYRILDLTDAVSGELRRSMPYQSLLWRTIYRVELPRIIRYEKQVMQNFDETWLISEAEKRFLLRDREVAGTELVIIPNGIDTERFRPSGPPVHQPVLIFVGHMSVLHNVDAAEHLVHDILPLVRASVPDARLHLVGAEPSDRVLRLGKVPGVQVFGHVNDLNAGLSGAAVFAAPLRFAAGIQNKVLEAMAAGLPVVTTSVVNEGLQADAGRHLIVADDPAAFAAAVVALLHDAERRQTLGRLGRDFVRTNYRWEDILERMKTIEQRVRLAHPGSR